MFSSLLSLFFIKIASPLSATLCITDSKIYILGHDPVDFFGFCDN